MENIYKALSRIQYWSWTRRDHGVVAWDCSSAIVADGGKTRSGSMTGCYTGYQGFPNV